MPDTEGVGLRNWLLGVKILERSQGRTVVSRVLRREVGARSVVQVNALSESSRAPQWTFQ